MTTQPDVDLTFYDYLEILYRRRWAALSIAAFVFAAMALYAFKATPVYRAKALVDVEKPEDVMYGHDTWQATEDDFVPTQARLMVSETALRRVYDQLGLSSTKEFAGGVATLRAAVTVLPVARTRLIQLEAESSSPRLAAAIANGVAQEYVRENLANELFMSRKVLAAVQARSRGRNVQAFYESLPAVAGSQRVQDLRTQIIRAESELARLRADFTDAYPAVQAAKSELDLLRAEKDREVSAIVNGLMTRLSGQFHANNVRVVDVALPPALPARPRRPLALLLGLVGGLLLGALGAFATEMIDETVRTHDDVESGLGLPMLGHIPLTRIRRGQRVYSPLMTADASPSSEAFRSLRTMVLFAKAADSEPSVLVTSATQEEGKSFVAANLAVALAQTERKVLLIDGDLRRPSQHRLFGAGADTGLADYLAGRVKDPGLLLQATEIPHLDVLSGGGRPPNPSELLSHEQLAQLVAWARERYDRVVVDCPPVFPVSDILLWGRHVRSAVLVTRAGRTRLPLVKMACARLHRSGIDILGGVINGSQLQTMSYADGHDFHRYCRSLPQPVRHDPTA